MIAKLTAMAVADIRTYSNLLRSGVCQGVILPKRSCEDCAQRLSWQFDYLTLSTFLKNN